MNTPENPPAEPFLLDATGREIMSGDVVKVLHFETRHGRGRKKHWMFKYVTHEERVAASGARFIKFSHLARDLSEGYLERLDGRQLESVWIVQGFGPNKGDFMPFDKRPKRQPQPPTGDE